METLTFKTTINCGGCVKAVTPYLNQLKGISSWQVATDHPDKILKVESGSGDQQPVVKAVQKAGFKIEPVRS